MSWTRVKNAAMLGALYTILCCSQELKDFTTPRPLPPGSILVVGFLGGFERWNDEQRGVHKVAQNLRELGIPHVYAETAGNHHQRIAMKMIRAAIDTNHNGRIDRDEAAAAKIILYGQSWGGAAVVKTARELNKRGVPVLLTVQVDSVGLKDNVIPANVRAAANFYQHDLFTIQGRSEIRAADPSRTRILGNQQYTYYFRPMDPSLSWPRRKMGGSHAKMEQDPIVWVQVEALIVNAIR
jgi:hypothetical protein